MQESDYLPRLQQSNLKTFAFLPFLLDPNYSRIKQSGLDPKLQISLVVFRFHFQNNQSQIELNQIQQSLYLMPTKKMFCYKSYYHQVAKFSLKRYSVVHERA